jgi:hypothetical protein
VKNTVISSHRVARKSLIQENTAFVLSLIHQMSVARAAAKSHTTAITARTGAEIVPSANHNNHITVVSHAITHDAIIIVFTSSGFSCTRSDTLSIIGDIFSTTSFNTGINAFQIVSCISPKLFNIACIQPSLVALIASFTHQ